MAAEDSVQNVITNALERANDAAALAESFSQSAQTAANASIAVAIPDVATPSIPTPLQLDPINLKDLYESKLNSLDYQWPNDLADRTQEYLDLYFPLFDELGADLIAWVRDVIDNGTLGLPAGYEDQLWDRERSRELEEMERSKVAATTFIGARGFSMPNAMMIARTDEADQKASNANITSARDQIIERLELSVKNVQFAVQQGVSLVNIIADAVSDYIKAYTDGTTANANRAKEITDAEARLAEIGYRYYELYNDWGRVQAAFEGLDTQKNISNAQVNVQAFDSKVGHRVQAAIAGAAAMGDLANAAMSANNTMSSIVHQTIA